MVREMFMVPEIVVPDSIDGLLALFRSLRMRFFAVVILFHLGML